MLHNQEEGVELRVKVVHAFTDKYTDEFCAIGSVMEVSDDRGNELITAGMVEVIAETVKKPKKK